MGTTQDQLRAKAPSSALPEKTTANAQTGRANPADGGQDKTTNQTRVPLVKRREENKMKKLTGATTRLERNVQRWANERAADYENGAEGVINDLFRGGCASGMVGHLIYYTDTEKFFQTHRREISALLSESVSSSGLQPGELFGDKWYAEDPLAQETHNRNLLAWFGFEEAARILADRNGIEV